MAIQSLTEMLGSRPADVTDHNVQPAMSTPRRSPARSKAPPPGSAVSFVSTPGQTARSFDTPFVVSHVGTPGSDYRERVDVYSPYVQGVARRRRVRALERIAVAVEEMEGEESEIFEKVRRGERLSKGKVAGVVKGGTLMSEDIEAMREVLERFDREGRMVEKENRGGSDEASYFEEEEEEEEEDVAVETLVAKKAGFTPLDVSTSNSLQTRLALYQTQYQHHREISEATLLHSGYTQCEVIEVIGSDVVDRIVGDVVAEVERGLEMQTEKLVRGL